MVENCYINSLSSIAKSLRDEGTDDESIVEDMNLMLSHLGALLLSKSKRTMNKLVFARDCCKNNRVIFTDTESLCIQKFFGQFWSKIIYYEKTWVKKKILW